jgi:uncharacterized protein
VATRAALLALSLVAPLALADTGKATLSWDALGQAGVVKKGDRFVPEYPKAVAALDSKEVKLQGFMMPLETAATQKRFLLTAQPSGCSFCMPGGPESVVEVQMKAPLKYILDAVTVTGKFVLVRDDASGLFYRLTDAVASDK